MPADETGWPCERTPRLLRRRSVRPGARASSRQPRLPGERRRRYGEDEPSSLEAKHPSARRDGLPIFQGDIAPGNASARETKRPCRATPRPFARRNNFPGARVSWWEPRQTARRPSGFRSAMPAPPGDRPGYSGSGRPAQDEESRNRVNSNRRHIDSSDYHRCGNSKQEHKNRAG